MIKAFQISCSKDIISPLSTFGDLDVISRVTYVPRSQGKNMYLVQKWNFTACVHNKLTSP